MKWLIAILILAILLTSGCSIFCQPSYVLGVKGGESSYENFNGANITDENCKKWCYENEGVSSYKVENNTCYCDINNCNP